MLVVLAIAMLMSCHLEMSYHLEIPSAFRRGSAAAAVSGGILTLEYMPQETQGIPESWLRWGCAQCEELGLSEHRLSATRCPFQLSLAAPAFTPRRWCVPNLLNTYKCG